MLQEAQSYSDAGREREGADWWQYWTFVVSIVVQLIVLGLSFASLFFPLTDLLHKIVALEFAVQFFEFLFYLLFLYLYWKAEKSSSRGAPMFYRYYDWIFSTSAMLCSLFLAAVYLDKPCASSADVANEYAWLFPVVIVCNLIMLYFGYVVETGGHLGGILTLVDDERVANWSREKRRLWMGVGGSLFLVAAFLPIIFVMYFDFHSTWGEVLVWITFAIWALYGVVAVYWAAEPTDLKRVESFIANNVREKRKNAAYNILDLVSKNAMGLLLAIIAFENSNECS